MRRRCRRTEPGRRSLPGRTTSTTASARASRSCSRFQTSTPRRRSPRPIPCSSTTWAATRSPTRPSSSSTRPPANAGRSGSELDSNAGSPADTALTINPAVNFASGHRYIVALRDLRTPDGSEISAPPGFRYYRDELPSDSAAINAQRQRFESIFEVLRGAGIRRSNLYLAWDFTVASDENIAGRMLHIRDDAFATLGDTTMADMVVQGASPAFSVDTVDDFTAGQDPNVARRIRGHLHRPLLPASGLRAGRPFRARRRRRPEPQRRLRGEVRLHHSAGRDRRADAGHGAPVALRPWPIR